MLAVAQILTAARHRIRGSLKFIFQPAEEAADDVLGPFGGKNHLFLLSLSVCPQLRYMASEVPMR